MAINFPTSLDTLSNPSANELLENANAALDHDAQHSNANDAIEALEAKVGINSSAVTTSHDYKLSEVTGSDKGVGKTATQTLTNKTLTSPVVNVTSDATGDLYYRNASGLFTRLPIGTSGQVLSANGSSIPEWIANPSASDGSTTVKGVFEEATVAEVEAATAAGGTGARLALTTSNNAVRFIAGYALTTGGDTYAVTYAPVPTAYITGAIYMFKADAANTGTASLNANTLGAKTIKKFVSGGAAALDTGDILANQMVACMYDGTDMIVISRLASENGVYGNGSTSYDLSTASGTQNIAHGLGRTPKMVRLFALSKVTGGVKNLATVLYNGTTSSVVGLSDTNGADRDMNSSGNIQAFGVASNQTEYQIGVVTFDATNIIITWTKTSSPTGTLYINWEANA